MWKVKADACLWPALQVHQRFRPQAFSAAPLLLYNKNTMASLDTTQQAPLALWQDGSIRIGNSRVTLDSVVHEFNRGSTAEQIQDDFPGLTLREIYGAISYYLDHKDRMEEYLRNREREAQTVRQFVEAGQDTESFRRRIGERYSQMKADR